MRSWPLPKITEFDRTLAVFDEAQIVATAGIFSYQMTVPGGTLACGGVTRVTVLPTHRRRGLLTAMMRRQLDDMHERGEPLAALYASEASIYGRFGYGLATYQASVEIDRTRAAFREVPSGGRISMVDVSHAAAAFARVWADACRRQPGMVTLDERWWRYELADLEIHREGASPAYRVLYERDGQPTGIALYRIKMAWDPSGPSGNLRLEFLIASTPEAYAGLWHFIVNVDLMARVSAEMRPVEEPLRFLLVDPRQPRTRVEDGIWLRLVDVDQALAGRRYQVEGRLTFGLRDEFCPWNVGLHTLQGGPDGAEATSGGANPDLELEAADLAVYLGGNRFRTLLEAGRIKELRQGPAARADAMFATGRAPWCPSHF
jgi:predicted acetyltransferase